MCVCVWGMTMITGCKRKKKIPICQVTFPQLRDITNAFEEGWDDFEKISGCQGLEYWGVKKHLLDKDKRRAGTLKIIIEARTLEPLYLNTYINIYAWGQHYF